MTIRVLLADDHALMRDGLKSLLGDAADIEVIGEVANGRDAMAAMVELAPDVVLMDISMPDMNGIEALRAIRDRHSMARIVMLSMHSSAEHVFQALSAGASGYLLKESAAEEVIAAVRTVHGGRQYLGQAIRHVDRRTQPRADGASPLDSLSTRERQVLQLVAEGKSSAEIARMVHLSPKTVETYRVRLMKKLGVANVTELVKFAVQHGVTSLD
jgi:DNA-binding NarL/FixJ family response regulator